MLNKNQQKKSLSILLIWCHPKVRKTQKPSVSPSSKISAVVSKPGASFIITLVSMVCWHVARTYHTRGSCMNAILTKRTQWIFWQKNNNNMALTFPFWVNWTATSVEHLDNATQAVWQNLWFLFFFFFNTGAICHNRHQLGRILLCETWHWLCGSENVTRASIDLWAG